ncbi:MAG: hypothetical protein ACRBB0_05050 [Pelagimonas sp.]|uniref:hypothetical protein n=1 Tax=Pelagimonas sp. TaxID=2073170 RepID=UPI003D6B1C56
MTASKTHGDKATDNAKAASTESTDTQPKQTVGTLVAELLNDTALSYAEIVALVKSDFPEAKTTTRSVASIASMLRRKGQDIPSRRKAVKAKK